MVNPQTAGATEWGRQEKTISASRFSRSLGEWVLPGNGRREAGSEFVERGAALELAPQLAAWAPGRAENAVRTGRGFV
jgi:hypothetical protein